MQRAGAELELKFVDKMRALKYQSDPQGICFGVAYTGMLSLLADNSDNFNKIFIDTINLTDAEIETLKNKIAGQNKAKLTQKEIDILALCDNIELLHVPGEYKKIIGANNNEIVTQSQLRAIALLAGKKLEAQGEVKKAEEISNVYTLAELTENLVALKRSVIDTNCMQPFSLVLTSFDHAVTIKYDKRRDAWFFIDAGRMPIHEINGEENMAKHLFEAFYAMQKPTIIVSTSVYVATKNQPAIQPCIDKWLSQQNLEVTPKKALTTDDVNASWLHIAARSGNQKLVKSLLEAGANVDQVERDTGSTSLYMAVHENHLNVIPDLMLYGADPAKLVKPAKSSPLDVALMDGNWLMVAAILVHLKPANKISSNNLATINQNRTLLASAFCKLMESDFYKDNYKELTQDVLNSQNALGKILNDPTYRGAFWLSRQTFHGVKVTGSIKTIGEWFDRRQHLDRKPINKV